MHTVVVVEGEREGLGLRGCDEIRRRRIFYAECLVCDKEVAAATEEGTVFVVHPVRVTDSTGLEQKAPELIDEAGPEIPASTSRPEGP